MVADFACAQRLTGAGAVERYALAGGEARERQIDLPRSHIRLSPTTPLRVHGVVTAVLQILVKLIYLFPLLLVGKLVLWATGVWYGDLITVGFVVLVVALFLSVAAATLTHLWVGPRSKRHEKVVPELTVPGPDAFERLMRALPAAGDAGRPENEPIRVRGRVRAGLAAGETVLAEQWSAGGGAVVRLFEGRSFVIDPAEGPVVVVELGGCPVLLGGDVDQGRSPSGRDVDGAAPELGSADSSRELGCDPSTLETRVRRALREGDEVELLARQAQPLDRLEDERLAAVVASAAEGSPYRAGQAGGRMVRVLPNEPVLLRVTGPTSAHS